MHRSSPRGGSSAALQWAERGPGVPVIWRAQAVALVLTAPLGLPEVLRAPGSPVPLFSPLALGTLGTGVAYRPPGAAT